MDNQAIGNKLKRLRIEKGLNQSQLGEHLNVSRTAIGNWERGDRSISITDLTVIAQYFGVPITYFTGEIVNNAEETVAENNVVIKVLKVEPKPNMVQLLIAIYLIIVSILLVYFKIGSVTRIVTFFYSFWFTIVTLMIGYQLFDLKKHSTNISFSSYKKAFFTLKDEGKITIDYFGHIFFCVLVVTTMIMFVIICNVYYQDMSLISFIIGVSLLEFAFALFASANILFDKPKAKFPYFPTNRYFSLLYYDVLFYSSLTFGVFMLGILILYGVSSMPPMVSIITIIMMLGMILVSYTLRLERRILFDRYKITIE